MARKRMIDPNFWSDEKIGECTIQERLLFMGLISNADDEGYGRANPKLLKSLIFPYDDLRASDLERWLSHLGGLNMVVLYEYDKQTYYYLPNFLKHQTINRPTESNFPHVEDEGITILSEYSMSTHGALTPKRKEDKLKEKNKKEYGEFGNVLLTDEEYEKLQKMFPSDYTKRIQSLDDYIQSKGKKYKDFVATLRNWARKEGYKFPEEQKEYKEVTLTEQEYLKRGKKYE